MLWDREYPEWDVRRGGSGGAGNPAWISLGGISFRADG